MSEDASLPPNAPMTNGAYATFRSGEADASSTYLRTICAHMHKRVSLVITQTAVSDADRRMQEQTRVALSVIRRALKDYE